VAVLANACYPKHAMAVPDAETEALLRALDAPAPPVLYHHPLDFGSQVVRLLLVAKDMAWQSRPVDTGPRQEQLMPWYLRLNPAGALPTMVHRGEVLEGVAAIAAHLDAVTPDPRLAEPAALEWLALAEALPLAALTYAGLPGIAGVLARRTLHRRVAVIADLRARHPDLDATYAAIAAETERRRAALHDLDGLLDAVEPALDRLEAHLAEGRPYLAGPRFGLADAAWTAVLARLRVVGLDQALIAGRPAVAAYAARMAARPGFRVAGIPTAPATAIWLRAAARAGSWRLAGAAGILFAAALWLVLWAG
jgi:tetrachloro-p-hydroquinone reductive dehalogenase